MLELVKIEEREPIEQFARRDLPLHIYELGDLDPFFWPKTQWYGLRAPAGDVRALVLLYAAPDVPCLLALGRNDGGALRELIERIADRLPERFYSHLSDGLAPRLEARWTLEHHGHYLKMLLTAPERANDVATNDVVHFGPRDHDELVELYQRAYPENWFDPRMLETGQYYGVRDGGRVVCVAGVHVYSPEFGVAALGNITTDPEHRGRGLARRATAALCQSLRSHIEVIGLNVRADNAAAIACYERLGFTPAAEYDEYMATS